MDTQTEILSEVESLKGRFSDTKALYREVCALLFFRYGITPTTNKLYQYVRKGTMSTPAEALAKFWDELRSKARVEIDHPDLPPEMKAVAAQAIAEIWRHATASARAELAVLRVELQAEQEQVRQDQAQAQLASTQALATVEQLRSELTSAHDLSSQCRVELEAERRAHAGAVARLQEVQAQLEQARAQQQRQQEAFSADLAKAREAVEAADRRAAAAEKRALLEIEQERQARAKSDKLAESLRSQLAQSESRGRQAALQHAETIAKLQAQLDAAYVAQQALEQINQAVDQEVRTTREQLLASQQEATRYRAEAQTVQSVLERLALAAPAASPKVTKKKASV